MTDEEFERLERENQALKKAKEAELEKAQERKLYDLELELAEQKGRDARLSKIILGQGENFVALQKEVRDFQERETQAYQEREKKLDAKLNALIAEREVLVKELAGPVRELRKQNDQTMEYLQAKGNETVARVKQTFSQLWALKGILIATFVMLIACTVSLGWIAWNIHDQTVAIQSARINAFNAALMIYNERNGKPLKDDKILR